MHSRYFELWGMLFLTPWPLLSRLKALLCPIILYEINPSLIVLIIIIAYSLFDIKISWVSGVLPCDQEVLVFEEQGLRDDVFMASQPVQPTFIDDVPHDHIRVLKSTPNEKKNNNKTSGLESRLEFHLFCTNLDTQWRICSHFQKQIPSITQKIHFQQMVMTFKLYRTRKEKSAWLTLEPVTSRAPRPS